MTRLIYISNTDTWAIHNFTTGATTPVREPARAEKEKFWAWADAGFPAEDEER